MHLQQVRADSRHYLGQIGVTGVDAKRHDRAAPPDAGRKAGGAGRRHMPRTPVEEYEADPVGSRVECRIEGRLAR